MFNTNYLPSYGQVCDKMFVMAMIERKIFSKIKLSSSFFGIFWLNEFLEKWFCYFVIKIFMKA